MKRPDYRTLQALDAVIRERGFERAAQKLCITQSAVSQRIKQL
ncbi:LysR family transcriptional regulator, partial [Escherichia coli]|nr:LysR family transcriptional regulator [Escherichia coli]MBN4724584.1 LysR family transcriptional regulator [Escherichia coli]MCV5863365.1 LysR family transcriptional regulator [Escherichia coli]HDU3654705.1 LysR family transcriptional regulator [Klebsiella quasipneumoniae subsp. similipneumoniae]